MAKHKRDYRKEYQRRMERGKRNGLSRSASRGHPRVGERRKQAAERLIDPNSREELALRMMREGSSLKEAASRYKIGRERLSTYVKESTAATFEKGRWKIIDRRTRTFPFYSNGQLVTPWMTLDQASEAGRYMHSVRQFLKTGDEMVLEPFRGKGVRDLGSRFHPFELDENILYELDHRGEVVIPEQYRISERTAK